MPRFAFSDQVTTVAPMTTCASEVRTAIGEIGANVRSGNDRDVAATMGSQSFRIMGGFLSPEERLPIEIDAHVEDAGAQRVIYLHVAEDMGIGLMVGMEGKYRHHCQDVLAQLTRRLSERLNAGG